MLRLLFSLLLLAAVVSPQQILIIKKKAAAASNIVKVQSVVCYGSGNYNCTIASSGAGNLITVVEFNYGTDPGVPSVPTDTNGDTFVQACTLNDGLGRSTLSYLANSTAGNTTVTVRPSSGASSAVVDEWSGVATSSPFIGCTGAQIYNDSLGYFFGAPVYGDQNVLALGWSYDRQASNRTYASDDNWATGLMVPQSSDGDEGFRQYIVNGLAGQFAARGTINTASSTNTSTGLFKSAVAGTSADIKPSVYVDFESGSNGSAINAAAINADSNGSGVRWTGGGSGWTFASAGQKTLHTPVAVNGLQYTDVSGAMGAKYDMSVSPGSSFQYLFPINTTSASLGVYFLIHDPVDNDSSYYSEFGISGGGGGDYVTLQLHGLGTTPATVEVVLEAHAGDSGTTLAISTDTWYWGTVQYNATGSHYIKIYETATWTLVGTLSAAAEGGIAADKALIGGPPEAGNNATYILMDNLVIDHVNGTFPIGP